MDRIESYISSVKSIPTASLSDTLGSVIEKTKSGSDAIFVFDSSKKNSFLGIVSPSYCLFKHRYPADTKLENCMIIPPHLREDASLFEVVTYMLALGVYTLPVFDAKYKIIGVISARRIIEVLKDNKEFLKNLEKALEIAKPLTATIHATVGQVYSSLRKEKSSRIVIVDNKGKVEGILTRRDIQEAFIAPSSGMRSSKSRGKSKQTIYYSEKEITRFEFPIAEFYKTEVVTSLKKARISEIIRLILEKNVNSVVLVDSINHPIGIVSVRSILSAFIKSKPVEKIPIVISDRHNLLNPEEKQTIYDFLERFAEKQQKIMPVVNLDLFVEAAKNPKGKVISYHVSLFEHLENGEKYGTQVEDKKLMFCVKEALRKIKHQQK